MIPFLGVKFQWTSFPKLDRELVQPHWFCQKYVQQNGKMHFTDSRKDQYIWMFPVMFTVIQKEREWNVLVCSPELYDPGLFLTHSHTLGCDSINNPPPISNKEMDTCYRPDHTTQNIIKSVNESQVLLFDFRLF